MLLTSLGTPALWIGFTLFVLAMLALDLGVFHRKAHVITVREATIWSIVWTLLAVAFGAGVWSLAGAERGLEFFTGWVIEKTLSVDNIFVIVMLFGAFSIPAIYQHRVLFWGILGALVMRALFIWAGAELLEHFHWTIYVFGALLLLTGIKMLLLRQGHKDPAQTLPVRMARRVLPMTDGLRGQKFWVREGGKLLATPLFLVLVVVEFTDLIFAVDSIPAIFAITGDAFLDCGTLGGGSCAAAPSPVAALGALAGLLCALRGGRR